MTPTPAVELTGHHQARCRTSVSEKLDPLPLLRRQVSLLQAEVRGEKAVRMKLEDSMARMWEGIRKLQFELRESRKEQKQRKAAPPPKPQTVADIWRERKCFICGERGRCSHREYAVDTALLDADRRARGEGVVNHG